MMNGSPPQVATYDGNLAVQVTLPLITWQNILNIIAEAPWKTADPLMTQIRQQVSTALESAQPVVPGNELRQ